MTGGSSLVLLALALAACSAGTTTSTPAPAPMTETPRAIGTFQVRLAPLEAYAGSADGRLARMSIDKEFHGDLEGTSQGEMLAASGDVEGSAGYVAIERFTGTLHGRSGSFVLQHSGTMDRGEPRLTVSVVPDSGTGELGGLTGTMHIIIAGGSHSYEFDYTLPDAP